MALYRPIIRARQYTLRDLVRKVDKSTEESDPPVKFEFSNGRKFIQRPGDRYT